MLKEKKKSYIVGCKFLYAKYWILTERLDEKLYEQNWLQFLFVVKTTALQQQISKFYPHIHRNYSNRIYVSQRPVIGICGLILLF